MKPSTPATAASGGNETETPTCGSTTGDAFAKFRAMVSQPTCACLAEAFDSWWLPKSPLQNLTVRFLMCV